ncbi:alcohol dehydrogenase catalytic domain-containing protein [Nonomuraea sp. NPDC049695]|uniref:alcohol dehydrogenase catalytic domain-containing protein n=1 Tax=Nonomuraea sp. NPDC049695 TaxID=3154734 RepID=UPI00342958DB
MQRKCTGTSSRCRPKRFLFLNRVRTRFSLRSGPRECAAATTGSLTATSPGDRIPYIPGHEIAGHVTQLGADVPESAGLPEGDSEAVDPAWGDGTCRQCHEGNEQLCTGERRGGSASGRPEASRSTPRLPAATSSASTRVRISSLSTSRLWWMQG